MISKIYSTGIIKKFKANIYNNFQNKCTEKHSKGNIQNFNSSFEWCYYT